MIRGILPPLRAAVLEQLNRETSTLTVALLPGMREAETLAEDLEFFAREVARRSTPLEVLLLPEVDDALDSDQDERDAEARLDQLATLTRLGERLGETKPPPLILITTLPALLAPVPEPGALRQSSIELNRGDSIGLDRLRQRLLDEMGYDAEAVCEYPGQLAVRGGLLDVYPFNGDGPVRIDFFGDEIDAIRPFDPTTQRSEGETPSISLAPCPERTEVTGRGGALLSYLGKGVQWAFLEPERQQTEYQEFFYRYERLDDNRLTVERILQRKEGDADTFYALSELPDEDDFFGEFQTSALEWQAEALEIYRERPLQDAFGLERLEREQLARAHFIEQLSEWQQEGAAIYLVAHNSGEAERLLDLFTETLGSDHFQPTVLLGQLARGFRIEGEAVRRFSWVKGQPTAIVLATENEILGRTQQLPAGKPRRKVPMRSRVDQMLDFSELIEGDLLVHLAHGICIFRGLSKMDLKDRTDEVISLEFADGIILHLPLHESHLLTRYLGLTTVTPKLGKLGRGTWEKARREAEKATFDFAAQLLRLQAQRAQGGGHAFSAESTWQRSFEAAFPYRETPDQAEAIRMTKADMMAPCPMDRLICGDVGFGKTEVAIRAAFMAVMDNKQVAILVPTTVLAQQHFNTFRERMAEYPVTVEMISRFRTPAEQKLILQQVAEGKIDILVGTHRLLSKDVVFKDLGLLVVDEEHRFGVRHKERLKEMRTEVDILTMSATPIPRTLYLALMGARDLSTIETPPANRRPIETIVRAYDTDLVRKAIRAELDRGGQVFYLHNRVQTIESVAERIRGMIPDAKVAVGHGQMTEDSLEDVMTRFVAREFDLLVCTTIIENGIDIPNCNTIIIEGADRFGLSQLYQLRGRVGRFNRQAYAYLLLHRKTHVKDIARERLSAMRQYNQLGAGFKIAMRDLELRGAGNLLGPQQSGHIAAVGFELYCQLLRQSVSRLKGEPVSKHIRATVNLDFVSLGEGALDSRARLTDFGFGALREEEIAGSRSDIVEAFLPHEYVQETRLRIDFYRRLALAETPASVDAITRELNDRFGPPPAPAKILLTFTRIRALAEAAGIASVSNEGNRLKCLRATGKSQDFLKLGARFPRLTAEKPLPRLHEIEQFLQRNSPQSVT